MEIEFNGAARQVTGSCHLLRVGERRVLVDCGMIQGSPEDEERNRESFPFDPAGIDAVILTHAHLDHSGRLPLLVASGFDGPIYTHRASRDLCRIMLKDAGNLNEKDAEEKNRRRRRKHQEEIEPLYTVADAEAAMEQFADLEYGTPYEVVPGVQLRLRDAGHILGSAIAEVWLEEGGEQRKLVFSGDLGHRGAPILRDPEIVHEADLVVIETTYGDRDHRSWGATWQELRGVIEQAHHEQGNIIIPSFAVGRTQDLLYTFGRHYQEWGLDQWTIFLDSPMAIEATEVYKRHEDLYDTEAQAAHGENGNPFHLPNLHLTRTTQQSMGINQFRSGAIIIAGSGMCTGGRVLHHLKHNLWRRGSHLLIVGFQAGGTLGRRLVEGAREVELMGDTIRVGAEVHTIGGLSAHADRDGLTEWVQAFTGPPSVALVHGETEAMDAFAETIRDNPIENLFRPREAERINLLDMTAKPPRKGRSARPGS
jgi:metallo-beta-lactamase family protein